jgi:hypothetical protein
MRERVRISQKSGQGSRDVNAMPSLRIEWLCLLLRGNTSHDKKSCHESSVSRMEMEQWSWMRRCDDVALRREWRLIPEPLALLNDSKDTPWRVENRIVKGYEKGRYPVKARQIIQ